MGNSFYLQMEGVNLASFIFDTQDLSTIRGGGLLLLNAPTRLMKQLMKHLTVEEKYSVEGVSMGASSGLLRITTENQEKDGVRKEAMEFLQKDSQLKHATFVVSVEDVPEKEEDFPQAREQLIAKNRLCQMRAPSLVMPEAGKTGENGETFVCKRDLIRPAAKESRGPGGEIEYLSESTYCRREYGKKQKQQFYEETCGFQKGMEKKDKLDFAHHFEQIAAHHPKAGHLDGKMAVIYIDGNGFGKIQREFCKTETLQKGWDTYLRGERKKILRALLDRMVGKEEWIWEKAEKDEKVEKGYRFETLLWGGDEIIWVVPAWKGWETLSFFFESSKDWEWNEKKLTHAAGIVFCNHKAPIHRIVALAKSLAEVAKEKDRGHSLFAVQVLESFDHLGTSVNAYLKKRIPGVCAGDFVLDGLKMTSLQDTMRRLISTDFPKRKLIEMARLASKGLLNETSKADVLRGIPKEAWEDWEKAVGASVAPMVGADLWDYLS